MIALCWCEESPDGVARVLSLFLSTEAQSLAISASALLMVASLLALLEGSLKWALMFLRVVSWIGSKKARME